MQFQAGGTGGWGGLGGRGDRKAITYLPSLHSNFDLGILKANSAPSNDLTEGSCLMQQLLGLGKSCISQVFWLSISLVQFDLCYFLAIFCQKNFTDEKNIPKFA